MSAIQSIPGIARCLFPLTAARPINGNRAMTITKRQSIIVAPPPYPPRMTPDERALAAKYGIDPRYYVVRGQRLVELHPDQCPAGHVLRGGSYVVGWRACLCVDGHTGHRLWICDCGRETGWPGCERGGFVVWGGVPVGVRDSAG